MDLYRVAVRPLLFRLDAETSHRATLRVLGALARSRAALGALERRMSVRDPGLRTRVAGIDFPGPVGLAAGFDKNAEAVAVTSRIGFGFVEVGSVSEHPSAGNAARPRVWRLPTDEALRVYYGCPNDGAEIVAARLRRQRLPVPLGVNVVETNTGTLATAVEAADEIASAVGRFVGLADYLVLNLSCPNMPQGGCGLFDDTSGLRLLLQSVARHPALPPVFLKLTPPGDPESPRVIDPILEAVDPFGFVKGFILNIPNRRPLESFRTATAELAATRGGITGPSLRTVTHSAIRAWYARIDHRRYALVGTGGICSAADAYETIRCGASLVQLYTALVYRGPALVARINEGLARLLARDGLRSIAEAVGIEDGGRVRRAAMEA
jgi:dihydroorotate dehydrogenase (fumarate)/dihydroorotate dehydrogenase